MKHVNVISEMLKSTQSNSIGLVRGGTHRGTGCKIGGISKYRRWTDTRSTLHTSRQISHQGAPVRPLHDRGLLAIIFAARSHSHGVESSTTHEDSQVFHTTLRPAA